MKEVIKKYVILLILIRLLIPIIPAIILQLFPDLMTFQNSDGGNINYGIGYLEFGMRYFSNIIAAIIIYYDLQKLKIKSISILILTIFSSATGIFFLLILAFEKNNILKNGKQYVKTLD